MPAIYMLDLQADFIKIFIAAALGGILGILFLIPFRKYFVKDMHGKYPFPEATATTQVLVSGGEGGSQAKPLLVAGLVGGAYDFIVATFGWWNENVTSRMIGLGQDLADKAKLVLKVNTGAAVLGLGYIIGLRYAAIICAGSVFVWWIIVPLMAVIFPNTVLNQWDPTITTTVGDMSPEAIFTSYARSMGIGAIAMAGIIGIVKSWGIIKGAVGLAAKEMKGKGDTTAAVKRTQRDISFKIIAIGSIAVIAITFLFFWLGVMHGNLLFAVVGILLVAIIAFLFTTVAANAIAIVGSNPVSGMTLVTEPASVSGWPTMVARLPWTSISWPPKGYWPSGMPVARRESEIRIMRSAPNSRKVRRTTLWWMCTPSQISSGWTWGLSKAAPMTAG